MKYWISLISFFMFCASPSWGQSPETSEWLKYPDSQSFAARYTVDTPLVDIKKTKTLLGWVQHYAQILSRQIHYQRAILHNGLAINQMSRRDDILLSCQRLIQAMNHLEAHIEEGIKGYEVFNYKPECEILESGSLRFRDLEQALKRVHNDIRALAAPNFVENRLNSLMPRITPLMKKTPQ